MAIEINRADTFENWRVKCNLAFESLGTNSLNVTAIQNQISNIEGSIGDLTSLQTTSKDSLTNAINELSLRISELNTRIDNL